VATTLKRDFCRWSRSLVQGKHTWKLTWHWVIFWIYSWILSSFPIGGAYSQTWVSSISQWDLSITLLHCGASIQQCSLLYYFGHWRVTLWVNQRTMLKWSSVLTSSSSLTSLKFFYLMVASLVINLGSNRVLQIDRTPSITCLLQR
jgi:hypothetical protein